MKKAAVLLVALLLTACGVKSTVIPSDPKQWDKLSDSAKHLSDEDRRLFSGYMARIALGSAFSNGKVSIPTGETIGKAIDEQRKFEADIKKQEAEADILKAKAAAERAAAEAALSNAALVTLVTKTYVPKDIYRERFSDRVSFVFAVQNRTAKDIAGIKGTLELDDMFGSVIKQINFSMDEDVAAGQTRTISGYGMDLNQFEGSDTKLAQTDLLKMKTVFHPEMIVFKDGTNMTTPESKGE